MAKENSQKIKLLKLMELLRQETDEQHPMAATVVCQKLNPKPQRTYTVKSGDTLWGIAKKELGSGARYTEIVQLNGLKTTTIYSGQVLKLPEK